MMAAAQRVALQLPPRRAQQDDFKKRTISRAEGGQLQAPVGAPRGFQFYSSGPPAIASLQRSQVGSPQCVISGLARIAAIAHANTGRAGSSFQTLWPTPSV